MTGFVRPKRFCVPENRNYTAVETKALDALEAYCERQPNPGWLCPACGRGNAPWQGTCPCKGWPKMEVTC